MTLVVEYQYLAAAPPAQRARSAHGPGKTSIIRQRAAATAFYLQNPGKTSVLLVLPPTALLLVYTTGLELGI